MIRSQIYRDPVAVQRMTDGRCPECGHVPARHDGGGGPGCSLTDNGVAQRLAKFKEESGSASAR